MAYEHLDGTYDAKSYLKFYTKVLWCRNFNTKPTKRGQMALFKIVFCNFN